MKFNIFTTEGIIIPPTLKITSSKIQDLNKQFKNTIIEFRSDTGPHGAYIPKENKIIIWLSPDLDLDLIATLINHEVIHSLQDQRSGDRMMDSIEKEKNEIESLGSYLDDLDDDEEIDPILLANLLRRKEELEIKMKHLNNEEYMAYAYMYAKMYKNLPLKKVQQKLKDEWIQWTRVEPHKKMWKYFASYWMVKDSL